jgi:rhamnose utilization protein RhaD (predicted bifunctional aldolase and dehydrogenase)/NAD(P)-dependent dehydrogenase (short-subunit alcohol dehydrogenase family)
MGARPVKLRAMHNAWDQAAADGCATTVELCAYASRLLGANPELVLHGGGNTSVKLEQRDILDDPLEVMFVKGSGGDLATIQPRGFTPLHLPRVLRLLRLETLSDTDMARELRAASLEPSAPAPSVEAILHALIPEMFVFHTHPDALLSITNTPSGERFARELYGNRVVVVPYTMPGFKLARRAWQEWQRQASAGTVGVVLLNHGLFTFASDAHTAYSRTVDLVTEAEQFLERRGVKSRATSAPKLEGTRLERAELRAAISRVAGRAMILMTDDDPRSFEFARRDDVQQVAARGPATPDHVIRTKALPMFGRDVEGYARAYAAYFERHATPDLKMLDPAPRVVIDPVLGILGAGKTVTDAGITRDIYRHTVRMVEAAETLETWQSLSERDLFEMEYWELEQAKLNAHAALPEFAGEVALVTGAASGIGRACAAAFLERGAAVVGLDLAPDVATAFETSSFLGLTCDITDAGAVNAALERAVQQFGGLDMLVLNAGIFPKSARIADLEDVAWAKAMAVNVDANLRLMRETHALLKLAPNGGRVVVNSSKNVPAPGPGAAAYSASKAALTQLARVAALEWGADGIRVNVMHPDAVFDTALWAGGVLEARAQSYGLSPEAYRTKNVLKAEVSSRHVAALAVALCGAAFARTTGAQIPVDGGNDRVI